MSNLSFARIMYGSNENPATTRWINTTSGASHLSNSIQNAQGPMGNWVRRILHSILPNRS